MTILGLLALAGAVYFLLVWLFVRNFLLAWICVLSANLLNFTFGSDQLLLAGIHLNPLDALYFCLLPAGMIRSRFHELRFSALNLLVMGYVFLFFLSVARGLGVFSLTTVGNEGRGLIGEVLALVYFTTIPSSPRLVKKIVMAQIVFSVALVLVCVAHYAGAPVGGTLGVNGNAALVEGSIDRALPAPAAASIEISLLFAASWVVYRNYSKWFPVLIATFAAAVIILQHRSVWSMLIVALLASVFVDLRVFRYLIRYVGAFAAVACIFIVASIGLQTRITGELRESATNSDTLLWRFESWERSVEEDQSALTMLIGLPVGSGYTRLDTNSGGYTEYPPHNEFINQYLRVGILGASLLLLFLLRPIYGYFQSVDSGSSLYPVPSSWVLVTVSVVVFCIPYSSSVELMGLVAMANGLMEERATISPKILRGRQPLNLPKSLSSARLN
jgi:hypothetical protein